MGAGTTILSHEPDGLGYYYGTYRHCAVNVKEKVEQFLRPGEQYWQAFVDGHMIGTGKSKSEAEQVAIAFIDAELGDSDGNGPGHGSSTEGVRSA